MMNEKKLSQMILKLHDRAEAAKYDGDSSPPYQEVEMLNFHDEESVVHTVLEDFPLFCPKCKYTCVIRFKDGKMEETVPEKA